MKKKKLIPLSILTTGLLFSSITGPAETTFAKPIVTSENSLLTNSDKQIINKINVDQIYQHIEYLSAVPRVAGTEAEYQAVQYIKNQLESYGYKTEIQEFTYIGYRDPSTVQLSVDGYSEELKPRSFSYTIDGNVTGELIYTGLGTKAELQNMDLSGKIALIQRGSINFQEKVLNAAEKGALAVIIYNNVDGDVNGTLGGAHDNYVPAVSITKAEGEALVAELEGGQVLTANVLVEGSFSGEQTSHNVIATKSPSNKKKATGDIIAIGAHHDSVALAPGANDNASGTAVVLELARVFKNLPTDTELHFLTYGAEELGLIGSDYYVNSLPQDTLNRIAGYFNLDMVGSRDAGDLVLNTVDGSANFVTELAQASSLRLNGSATPYQEGGRSDHVSFFEAGIPSASFIHSPTEPWYHTPEDSIDKISKEKLLDVTKIVGTAVYDYAKLDQKGPKSKSKKGKKQKFPELHHKKQFK
ncbi:MAG: M28 family peptidase [Bacillus sp. (in: firmicutes)]